MNSPVRRTLSMLVLLLLPLAYGGCVVFYMPLMLVGNAVANAGVEDLHVASFTPLSDNLSGPETRITYRKETVEGAVEAAPDEGPFASIAVERGGVTVKGGGILYVRAPEGFPYLVTARVIVENDTDHSIELIVPSTSLELRRRDKWRLQDLRDLSVKIPGQELISLWSHHPVNEDDSIAKHPAVTVPAKGELDYGMAFHFNVKIAKEGRYRIELRDSQTGEVYRYQFDTVRTSKAPQ